MKQEPTILSFPEHPNFVAVLYTRESAPHERVLDVERGKKRYRFDIEAKDEHWAKHAADPKSVACWPCAACHWNDMEVKKARAAKKARLMAFARTRKLPAAWMKPETVRFGGAQMSDEEASRVVLPRLEWGGSYGVNSDGTGRMHYDPTKEDGASYADYLEALGEKRVKGGTEWSCGCHSDEPCKKHRDALKGRDEDTGEWL